jgi:hypothetical protein
LSALRVAAVLILAAGGALAVTTSTRSGGGPGWADVAGLPATPAPGLDVGPAVPLPERRGLTRWQAVRRATIARSAPSPRARPVGVLPARTPEGTTNIVLPTGTAKDRAGGLWIRVALPALPNGIVGWVPRTALGADGTVATRLVVDRRRLRATLLRDGRAVFAAPIGIGALGAPTPRGRFVVRDRLVRYRSPFYGPVAFGTSARSPTLTDWPAGGFVGIHGTDRPGLIPGRVSHGCVRMRNADILRLARLMPVGTPVTIR